MLNLPVKSKLNGSKFTNQFLSSSNDVKITTITLCKNDSASKKAHCSSSGFEALQTKIDERKNWSVNRRVCLVTH